MNEILDTYIYLAKRDKKGIRILTVFKSQKHVPERVDSLLSLPLELNVVSKMEQIAYDNRAYWEVWVESSKTFEGFRDSVRKRGYSGIPVSPLPEVISLNGFVNRPNIKKPMIQK